MFGDLHDMLSRLWSWTWPVADGEVTTVHLWHKKDAGGKNTIFASVHYRFSVGDDGPYLGIRDWSSVHYLRKDLLAIRRRFPRGSKIKIRYRADDPSVNELESRWWRLW